LRALFKKNWPLHYKKMKDLIDEKFFYKEFIAVVERATKNRIWNYRGLTEGQIPYVLCCLADFNGRSGLQSPKRKYWYRFWFSRRDSHLEELWIRPQEDVYLIAGSYDIPADSSIPGTESLVDLTHHLIDANFLQEPRESLHPGIVRGVENWFKAHPRLFP
jgi:hypothetical protein